MDPWTKYLGGMELGKTHVNFGHLDTDLSECLTLDEFKAQLKLDLPEDEIIEIYNLAEQYYNGCVNDLTFIPLFIIIRIFEKIDLDNNRCVNWEEFQADAEVFAAKRPYLVFGAYAIFVEMDLNGNGCVTKKEIEDRMFGLSWQMALVRALLKMKQ